jgi:hypothetical protein
MKNFFYSEAKFIGENIIPGNKIKCGWCDSIISPNRGYEVKSRISGLVFGYIYICPNCNEIILYRGGCYYPQESYGKVVKNLPKDVESIYEECRNCFSIGAYTSISLLARKLLMHICVQEGAEPDKSFKYYVEYLEKNNYIPPKSKHILTFIKDEGNEANHQIIIKKKEDAEKILDFVSMILIFIYEYADEKSDSANGES